MIVSTFQGVGKSTLAEKRLDIIDLESSCFDKANKNWYLDYCRIAMDLERQGYIVFVSAHKCVRDYLKQFEYLNYVMISYDIDLMDYAIDKLRERYKITKSMKDYNALKRAETSFGDIYAELQMDSTLRTIWLREKDYDLESIIDKLNKQGV